MNESILPTTGIVIVFIRLKYQSQREKMNGIYSAATRLGWQILPADEQFSARRLRELISHWHPLGCLIDGSSLPGTPPSTKQLALKDLANLPTVLLGRDMTRTSKMQIADCSVQNPRSPVMVAVEKFRNLGIEHFAYFGDPLRPQWSIERENHFRLAVKSWDFHNYEDRRSSQHVCLPRLAAWLTKLPKPIGLLLAADHMALPLYTAAKRAGLTIGSDLVVIGVDNDDQICNSLVPTLSSVRLDYFQAGFNGVELLVRRIANPQLPIKHLRYGSIELVSRSSTAQQYADKRVNAGVLFVEEHACEHVSATDVAAVMGCSRRMAEKLFVKHVKQTILDAIRKIRLSKAKELLANSSYPIEAVPGLCGYDSTSHMKTYFRKQTGLTMLEWRRKHNPAVKALLGSVR